MIHTHTATKFHRKPAYQQSGGNNIIKHYLHLTIKSRSRRFIIIGLRKGDAVSLLRQNFQSVRPLVENLSSGSNNCSFLVLEYFHKWRKLMKMEEIDKEMEKIDQK